MSPHLDKSAKGTALLAVLWLTAALSAIALSVADTVRAEVERAIATQESTRAYYLARGAVERALHLLRNPEGFGGSTPSERFASRRRLYFQEQTGDAIVEFIAERGKLPLRDLNISLLERLLVAMNEPPASASRIAAAAFSGGAAFSQNSQASSAFIPSIASMENVEELLLLPGMTQEIVYGRYTRLSDGSLVNAGGLVDFFSPHIKENNGLDPLSVHPTLLIAMGANPFTARAFAEARRSVFDPNMALAAAGGTGIAMRAELGDVFQIRATGRPRLPNGTLSPARRSVALLIKFTAPNPRYMWLSPWAHLRWYDQTFSDLSASNAVWMTPPPPGTRP